jgi:hypothetical protein
VKSPDKAFAATETRRLEDYFLDGLDVPGGPTGLETRVGQQQASYGNRVRLLTGLNPAANGEAVTGYFDRYYWAAVTPEQAALEMGYSARRGPATVEGRPYPLAGDPPGRHPDPPPRVGAGLRRGHAGAALPVGNRPGTTSGQGLLICSR